MKGHSENIIDKVIVLQRRGARYYSDLQLSHCPYFSSVRATGKVVEQCDGSKFREAGIQRRGCIQ